MNQRHIEWHDYNVKKLVITDSRGVPNSDMTSKSMFCVCFSTPPTHYCDFLFQIPNILFHWNHKAGSEKF